MSTIFEKLKTTEIYPMETCFDLLDLTSTQALARENHRGNVILSYDGNASKRKIEGDRVNLQEHFNYERIQSVKIQKLLRD